MATLAAIFVPTQSGRAAGTELSRVPWHELDHAYGTGVCGPSPTHDVAASLRRLCDDDREAIGEGCHALYGNIYHQGTIYEATAYAVPFLAAIAAGHPWRGATLQLLAMLGRIALSSSHATEDGGHAGAYGDGVDVQVRAALRASAPWLRPLCEGEPLVAAAAQAILAYAEDDAVRRARLAVIVEAVEAIDALDDLEPPPEPAAPLAERWVEHGRFGRGRVLEIGEGKLRVRFDDAERWVLLRFLSDVSGPE